MKAQARLNKAKTTLNSISGVAIARERIAQEKARGEATLSRLQQEREQLIQRRIELENQLNSYQKEFKQIEIDWVNPKQFEKLDYEPFLYHQCG